jgi:DNA mismatch repair ATPase MutS
MAIEDWRGHCGADIAEWVAAVGEFEALLALAGFAFERPGAIFPELSPEPLDTDGHTAGPSLESTGLVHVLIAPDEAVANDVQLGGEMRMWIVSGSNMSGKSTLLRAVGLATVMAWAGAPVTAERLRLSHLEVGASLRNVDSLADHRSRFYAEITRLRRILDLTRGDLARAGRHTLFLLDELLSGTNSQDRRLGASALLRGLVDRGAIGLDTTKAIALAAIVDELGGRPANIHLKDQLVGGEMYFDYHLRPGVVERGNALALMRAVGLEV